MSETESNGNGASDGASERRATRLRLIDTVGRLMEFWGFRRPLGRVWTLLYLAPEPLAAVEVGTALCMSSGAVSSALGELVEWGAVRKVWRPGARRAGARLLYEAEPDVWRMVTRVLRERELPLVREAASVFEEAQRTLVDGADDDAARVEPRVEFERGRIETLSALARVGEVLLADLAGARAPQVDAGAGAQAIVAALSALTLLSQVGAAGAARVEAREGRSADDHSE